MQIRLEEKNPVRDMGGLCECFVQRSPGLCFAAYPHIHPAFELLYCLEGAYELKAENSIYRLGQGDVALIHPMEPHEARTLTPGENSYLVLKFTPEALLSSSQPHYEMKYIFPYLHFGRRSCVYTRQETGDSGLEDLLMKILQERQQEGYGYEMAVRAYISQVLLWFIRAWHIRNDAMNMDEATLSRLQKSIAYISAHLEEEMSIQAVADHVGMGLSTFSRFFVRATGSSFPAFVRGQRLNAAMRLLLESEKSITDIAMETGFSSASYLILCFRRQYHLTPAQFRHHYISAARM